MQSYSRRTTAIAARSIILWFAVSCLRGAQPLELYSYTTHQKLLRGDEETSTVSLTTPFVLFRQNYSEISVSGTFVVESTVNSYKVP